MNSIDSLIYLFKDCSILSPQLSTLNLLKEKNLSREITVSCIGCFKRGKSSLLNAVLKSDILPVGVIPLTAIVTEIRYAHDTKVQVLFKNGDIREADISRLYEYCSEEKNRKNFKNVEKVMIETPCHPFGEGIVLVDTPGVGSINEHNTATSREYVKSSDAVIFLLSTDSPVNEIERDFLKEADAFASKFFFAVNKCDTVSPSDLDTFISYCRETISEIMGEEINITAVSAKTGYGIDKLLEILKKDIFSSKDEIIRSSLEKKLEIIKKQAEANLSVALKASCLPFEKLEEKLNAIEIKKEELSGFNEEVNIIASHRTKQLTDNIRAALEKDSEGIKKDTEIKCKDILSSYIHLDALSFEKAAEKELNSFLKEKLDALNKKGQELLEEGYKNITDILNEKSISTAGFLSSLLKEQFGLDYPIYDSDFKVTSKSDFIMHIGLGGTLLIDKDAFNRLLPKKTANTRFMKRCLAKALQDIDFNRNNMISNYRYKMQESLRTMCGELNAKIEDMEKELDIILKNIEENLSCEEDIKEEKTRELNKILYALKEL